MNHRLVGGEQDEMILQLRTARFRLDLESLFRQARDSSGAGQMSSAHSSEVNPNSSRCSATSMADPAYRRTKLPGPQKIGTLEQR